MKSARPDLTLIHFMRRGQVFHLRPFFPSVESWELALKCAHSDAELLILRQQQEQRNLTTELHRLHGSQPHYEED